MSPKEQKVAIIFWPPKRDAIFVFFSLSHVKNGPLTFFFGCHWRPPNPSSFFFIYKKKETKVYLFVFVSSTNQSSSSFFPVHRCIGGGKRKWYLSKMLLRTAPNGSAKETFFSLPVFVYVVSYSGLKDWGIHLRSKAFWPENMSNGLHDLLYLLWICSWLLFVCCREKIMLRPVVL